MPAAAEVRGACPSPRAAAACMGRCGFQQGVGVCAFSKGSIGCLYEVANSVCALQQLKCAGSCAESARYGREAAWQPGCIGCLATACGACE